jgi:hypothetical protein
MTRRAFLLTPLTLAAQPSRPRVALVWSATGIPAAFAREAVVFPRAYTCCPDRIEAAWALEHGRFPHAARSADRSSDASLWDYFERAPAGTGNAITIMTSHSADGNDSPFERSIHVPLAIRWPGRLTPRVANEVLFSHVDLLPTLLGMTGIARSSLWQGRDLSSVMGEVPDSVYIEGGLGTREEWRALVRGFDKITWNLRDEITGLYNLADDPGEETSLRDLREHRLMQDSMFALGHQWMDRLQDGRDAFGLRTRRPL